MKSKAIFLLVIFLLNTVVGFGCALGMEGNHDGKSHSHAKSPAHVHTEHSHSDEHKQNALPIFGQDFSKEDGCCKTLVNDLVTQSKLVPEIGKVQIVLPIMLLPDYSYALFIPVTVVKINQSVLTDHRERPPNQDIRIVIQSFQI